MKWRLDDQRREMARLADQNMCEISDLAAPKETA